MEEFIPKFVQTPYITPLPNDPTKVPYRESIENSDTLQTLFVGCDSSFIMDSGQLNQMMLSLNQNISQMENLQTEVLEPGPPPNLHSGSISLWLKYLCEPEYHLFSLNPVPDFEFLTLERLISDCVDMKVPQDRAGWAIHRFAKAKNLLDREITNTFINQPRFYEKDMHYFVTLGYELYSRNLLQHSKFIEWMIQEIDPSYLAIFKNELLKTHSLLFYAFQTVDTKKYIEFFKKDLLLNQSQLIQFAIVSHIGQYNFQEDVFKLLETGMKKRAKKICDLTQPKLTFSSILRNMLYSHYPYFDTESFASSIKKMLHFSDNEELKSHILSMCRSVLWFNQYITSISFIIAYLISNLISMFSSITFPLNDFIDILYNNCNDDDEVSHFSVLFAELQNYNLFEYYDFLKIISQRGLLFSKREQTARIILNMPCISKKYQTLSKLKVFLDRILPPSVSEDIKTILSNPYEKIDKLKQLPHVMKHQLGMYFVDHSTDFRKTANIISHLGLPILLVNLFQKTEKDKISLSMEIVPVIEEIIPALSTKKILNKFIESICMNPSLPANLELIIFISEHYKSSNIANIKQLNELSKNSKIINISKECIMTLFQKHSYLCSLQIYDSIFSLKTVKDFISFFQLFIRNLLMFEPISTDDLYMFFKEFSEMQIITRPAHVFIKFLLNNFMQTPELVENERVVKIIEEFFYRVLTSKIIEVSTYLNTAFSITRKGKNKSQQHQSAYTAFHIILNILESSPQSFPVESVLTEPTVRGLIQCFAPDNGPYIELLSLLRKFCPPIITSEILKIVETPDQQGMSYAAALFSLLPTPLHSADFVDVFDFFKMNVTRTTSTFWSLWLKLKPNFTPGLPVSISQPDKEAISTYQNTLISAFSSLLFHATPGDEKTLVYLNCWSLLCENNPLFCKKIVNSILSSLRANHMSLSPMVITFLHPSLMIINEQDFEQLCDELYKYKYDESQFEEFARTASSIFAIFVTRFSNNPNILPMIADKVLEWVINLYLRHAKSLEFILDVFNFVLCFSNDENPSNGSDEINMLQANLHLRIKNKLEEIPEEIDRFIILNMPPQSFKEPKEPLYSEFTLEIDQDSTQYQQQQYSPDHNDSGFSTNFDTTSIFPPFDDDYQPWF